MDVHVDEAGCQVEAGGIDHIVGRGAREILFNSSDGATGKSDISASADSLGWIYERCIPYNEVVLHGEE